MENSSGANATEVLSLTRRFNSLVAVDHLTFSCASGATFGLLGPNGAGKSTVIKMLTTLLPPSEGTAKIAGCDLVRHPEAVRRKIGYVSQSNDRWRWKLIWPGGGLPDANRRAGRSGGCGDEALSKHRQLILPTSLRLKSASDKDFNTEGTENTDEDTKAAGKPSGHYLNVRRSYFSLLCALNALGDETLF
jgi:ABC-type arginine transport system ATPase subunit